MIRRNIKRNAEVSAPDHAFGFPHLIQKEDDLPARLEFLQGLPPDLLVGRFSPKLRHEGQFCVLHPAFKVQGPVRYPAVEDPCHAADQGVVGQFHHLATDDGAGFGHSHAGSRKAKEVFFGLVRTQQRACVQAVPTCRGPRFTEVQNQRHQKNQSDACGAGGNGAPPTEKAGPALAPSLDGPARAPAGGNCLVQRAHERSQHSLLQSSGRCERHASISKRLCKSNVIHFTAHWD